jgi:hypothetical protein
VAQAHRLLHHKVANLAMLDRVHVQREPDAHVQLTLKRRGMTEGLCVTLATTQGLKDWMESACQSIEG